MRWSVWLNLSIVVFLGFLFSIYQRWAQYTAAVDKMANNIKKRKTFLYYLQHIRRALQNVLVF